MRRIMAWITVFACFTFMIFTHGCAQDKSFAKKEMSSISPLHVVRYDTPIVIREFSFWRTMGGFALFGVGGAVTSSWKAPSSRRWLASDLGQLAMQKFCDHAAKEVPGWPAMTVEESPVKDDYVYPSGTLLTFRVDHALLEGKHGLLSTITVTMKDSQGEVLWRKNYEYRSSKFDRNRSISEFVADDYKLLGEEMDFATEKTVQVFIEHFREEEGS